MAVDVTVEAVIERPIGDVAAFAGDPGNAPDWYANIRSVHWRTSSPLEVGSQMDFVATFLGRQLSYTYEVVDLVVGERLVMRTSHGPFPMETTYEWSDIGCGRTLMRLRNRGEPSGFSRVTASMMSVAVRRNTTKDLARLKRLLEQ
jgi:Polyketide cyclase / dehydrase and lipid transport